MLEFEVIQGVDGEYVAACNAEQIYVEGETLQMLYDNMLKGVKDKFGADSAPKPSDIKCILFKEEPVSV